MTARIRSVALLALFLAPALLVSSVRPMGSQAGAREAGAAGVGPVVVELFTSQGCSSCPPAEAYLGELAGRPGIVALEFHVDYWDYIGWADPFADGSAQPI